MSSVQSALTVHIGVTEFVSVWKRLLCALVVIRGYLHYWLPPVVFNDLCSAYL